MTSSCAKRLIRKCPHCGGRVKPIAFEQIEITVYASHEEIKVDEAVYARLDRQCLDCKCKFGNQVERR